MGVPYPMSVLSSGVGEKSKFFTAKSSGDEV